MGGSSVGVAYRRGDGRVDRIRVVLAEGREKAMKLVSFGAKILDLLQHAFSLQSSAAQLGFRLPRKAAMPSLASSPEKSSAESREVHWKASFWSMPGTW